MPKDPATTLEERWFNKLNNPNSGTYRLAHAMRHDPCDRLTPFDPAKVSEGIEATAEQYLADHIAASKL